MPASILTHDCRFYRSKCARRGNLVRPDAALFFHLLPARMRISTFNQAANAHRCGEAVRNLDSQIAELFIGVHVVQTIR